MIIFAIIQMFGMEDDCLMYQMYNENVSHDVLTLPHEELVAFGLTWMFQ